MEFPEGSGGVFCGLILENPGGSGGGGGHMKNPFRGWGMDIFWNHTIVHLHLKYKWLLHGMQALQTFQFQLQWNPALGYLVIMTTFLCPKQMEHPVPSFLSQHYQSDYPVLMSTIPMRNNPMEFHGLHGIPWNSMEFPWNSMEVHGILLNFMECPSGVSIEFHGVLDNLMFHGGTMN